MDWIKRNLMFVIGGVITLVLMGLAGWYCYSGWNNNVQQKEEIAKAKPPVVALGHSLGGVILVDLLTQPDALSVARLVTVGSQSPLFYAIDALDRIRRKDGGPDPAPFTPWLNVYDRADILSFVAGRVFPGLDNVKDEEIDSRVPFPSAHSAYFHQPRTFELMRDFWPK